MAEAPERYCSNCGQELLPEDRFCSNCGRPVHRTARVPTPEADVPVPPPQQAQRSVPPHLAGAASTQSDGRPYLRSGQEPLSIKEMLTLGVGAGVFTLLTSPWLGVEKLLGKLFFAILTPMMVAVIRSIIKAYLSGTGFDGRILGILTALWRFGALPWETKKSILLATLRGTARAAVVLSIISVSTVVGIQAIKANINPAPPPATTPAPPPTTSPTTSTASPTATSTASPTASP